VVGLDHATGDGEPALPPLEPVSVLGGGGAVPPLSVVVCGAVPGSPVPVDVEPPLWLGSPEPGGGGGVVVVVVVVVVGGGLAVVVVVVSVGVVDSSVVVPLGGDDGSTVVWVCDCVRPGGGGFGLAVFVFATNLVLWALFAWRLSVASAVVFTAGIVVVAGLAGLVGLGCGRGFATACLGWCTVRMPAAAGAADTS
jgi:hypothetical protein